MKKLLSQPRSDVTEYKVSAAVSFSGQIEGREGIYVTYANFFPGIKNSFEKACQWLELYVKQYTGTIITDFDEVRPRFPETIFGLPNLMSGRLDKNQVQEFLQKKFWDEKIGEQFFRVYVNYISVGNIINSEGIAIGENSQTNLTKNLENIRKSII